MLESSSQSFVRLEAATLGIPLWRNNVGAVETCNGFIRFGLANDSKAMNERTKSSDLIGIRPIRITPIHVGSIIGQFIARETKRAGWKYQGTAREKAQLHYLELVNQCGGDGQFCTGPGTL